MNAPDDQRSPTSYPLSNVLWQVAAPFTRVSDSLVAQTYEILWKQIVEGDRQPGERLIAGEIARELSISRTPVQQALYQLHQTGLVDAGAGRGFHVVIFSATDIRDLYDTRIILEVAAVQAATPHIPEIELQEAQETIIQLQQSSSPDLGQLFLQSDVQFHHELIARHIGNRRLEELVAHQRAYMSLFMVDGTRQPHGITTALAEHSVILRALMHRDASQASIAMEQHLQRVKEDALRQLATRRTPRVRRFRSTDVASR